MTTTTATPPRTRPLCPCCSQRMTSDEDTVLLSGVGYHSDCVAEVNADLDARDADLDLDPDYLAAV